MTAPAQIGIAFASVAVLLGLMALVKSQASRFGMSAEVQRKLVHIGTGLYALTLPWLFPDRWPVFMLVGLTLVVMIVLRMPRFAKGGIGETLHGVERQSYGDILLALAVGTVFLLSDGRAILYVLPIAILTLADAAAALAGSRYGSKFFTVEEGRKSIEGSVIFFMVALILSMICLLLLSDVPRENVILLALIVAAFATQIEAESWRGYDNFFLPAGVLIFLESNLNSTPATLITIMTLFTLAIFAFIAAAPRLGLTSHAARVYVISAFVLLSVTAVQNTILPLIVFAAHAIGRRNKPCRATYPELDMVAALALASFAWQTIGFSVGLNALSFYGLHAMGLSVGLIALGFDSLPSRLAAGALSAAVLIWLYFQLIPMNGATVAWTGNMWPLAIGTALLAAIIPALRPAVFDTRRAAKMTLLSALIPTIGYAINGAAL